MLLIKFHVWIVIQVRLTLQPIRDLGRSIQARQIVDESAQIVDIELHLF